jgi:folate-dependent phosphoribosylglycinamide formyltransferase PurN
MKAFVILTTWDLPEAYYLATALEARKQRIGIVNICGRSFRAKLRVLRRLRRNRGLAYLVDLLLARALRRRYMPSTILPFRDIDAGVIAGIKRRWPTHTCVDPHAPDTLRFVRDFGADYMLLAGTPVLKPSLYGLARHGAFNRHLGMLPEYKGSDCPLWALAQNDPEHLGFTLHRVAEKVDGGDVIHREQVPIVRGESFVGYMARFQRRASDAMIDILDRLIADAAVDGWSQEAPGRYFPPAGLSALRRARVNFERLAQPSTGHESEPVAA